MLTFFYKTTQKLVLQYAFLKVQNNPKCNFFLPLRAHYWGPYYLTCYLKLVQYFLSFALDLQSSCSKGLLLKILKKTFYVWISAKTVIHNALQNRSMNLVINSLWKRKLTTIEGKPKKNILVLNVRKKIDIKS